MTSSAPLDSYSPEEIAELLPYLTAAERKQIDAIVAQWNAVPWRPHPENDPQRQAYESKADIIGYGGAAGGGKTDLACGKTLTQHQKVMILRRVGTELTGIIDRLEEIVGNKVGYNGKDNIWRLQRYDGVKLQIEFGSVPDLGNEKKFQGRPHDLLVFDEAANFLEAQVRFLMGWVRSVDPDQPCQTLMCFNPPTDSDGQWIVDFFAPWLNKKHPLFPTPFGQIRYAAMIPADNGTSKDAWVDRPDPFVIVDGEFVYDFDPDQFAKEEIITPKSRTFIPAKVTDNPYLYGTGYMAQLQALPEPLRSQMLKGDFLAGMNDDPWQVIPTLWIEAAMARWREPNVKSEMDSMGVDVARGGKDQTTIARRHGNWFDRTLVYPGTQTPDGPAVSGLVIAALRDAAPIHIDVIGVGASPYDFLRSAKQQVIGVNVAEKSLGHDRSGRLSFANLRSELWWRMREWLDPSNNTGAMLPDESELLAELTAPKWRLRGPIIEIESRDQIIERIGRSPDRASAYILGLIETPKMAHLDRIFGTRKQRDYNPYE
jgi:hypothetical protein